MRRLLVPDAGPLFSLGSAGLLPLLANFRLGVTDVVRDEAIRQGHLPTASAQAQSLLAYFDQNAATIEIFTTQVGTDLAALRALDPSYRVPRNLGELSIQSLLIHLQMQAPGSHPVILFEDSWFLHNTASLTKPCTLLSTQAFLEYAQEKRWIASAAQARRNIETGRSTAFQETVLLQYPGADVLKR